MKNKKRAIILDMDETLEHAIHTEDKNTIMVLRPNLDELIAKLQEAKNQEIDIVLCTTARNQWVEKFLTLKPEMRTLFDKMLTRDNEEEWQSKQCYVEKYPIEYEYLNAYAKPVTTFGYDSILFIDDNKTEANRLRNLFEKAQGKLEKDVTYFSGFGFIGGSIDLIEIFAYKNIADQNPKFAQKLKEYLEIEKNEPGCHIMCSVIDDFMSKEFKPGLTLADEQYFTEYNKLFYQKISSLEEELEDMEYEISHQTGKSIFEHIDSELAEVQAYLDTDKRYPYEGIEVNKREELENLIQTAISTKSKLDEAEKLKESYGQNTEEKSL